METEVNSRIDAIRVGVRAQVVEQLRGRPLRSSRMLTSSDEHVLEGAAKHMFNASKPFAKIKPSEARTSQGECSRLAKQGGVHRLQATKQVCFQEPAEAFFIGDDEDVQSDGSAHATTLQLLAAG